MAAAASTSAGLICRVCPFWPAASSAAWTAACTRAGAVWRTPRSLPSRSAEGNPSPGTSITSRYGLALTIRSASVP